MKTTKLLLTALLATVITVGFSQTGKIGDNLGNHTATKDLNLSNFNITNAKVVNADGMVVGGVAPIDATSVSIDLQATNKAIIFNRVTSVAAIATPVNGMAVYAADKQKFYLRENGAWITFASTTDGKVVMSLNMGSFATTSSTTGATLTDDGKGNLTLSMTPADATNPGAVSTTTQTFAGAKTFNDNVVTNKDVTFNGLTNSTDNTASVLVIDGTGKTFKSTLTSGVIQKLLAPIPSGTSALFTESNMYITFTITATNALVDDGVTVNFANADATSFEGLEILSARVSATNTVTIKLADNRAPVGWTAPAIDGKNLVVTWMHKN